MMKRGDTLIMNDFKIIKCKKCNAALVEMQGKKLDRCIQCGYLLNPTKDTKITNKGQVTSYYNTFKTNSAISYLIKKLREMKIEKRTDAPEKKKSSFLTIIKWYFIIAFGLGILSSVFSY